MTTGEKLEQIAENQQKVFDAGYEKGQAEGGFVKQEAFDELLARVEDLEQRVTELESGSEPDIQDGFSLTFANYLMTTNFTLSIDGGEEISGEECVGKTFVGTEFVFGNLNDNAISYTSLTSEHGWTGFTTGSYTLTLTEDITNVDVAVH